jgi:hypothetical protein
MKKWAHELNKEFSKKEVQMTSKFMKKCSIFLVIKEMQIKTTLRFHLTPVTMDNNNNKCWQECGKTGTLIRCWWQCKLVQLPWKAAWRFLKKLKIELPYNPVILFLGACPKKCKSGYNRDTSTLMFITEVFTTDKLWKQPRCPTTEEWAKKLYIYTMEYYSAIKNNDMGFEGKWMQLEDIMLSEVSQA